MKSYTFNSNIFKIILINMNKTALLLLFICCSLNNLNAQYSLVDTYFDGSKFLSITTNGYLLESTDGINWNENNFAIGSWTDIGYNNSNVHVIVGASTAYFKQGSNSWQASSVVPAGYWTSVIYDTINNLFVALAGVIVTVIPRSNAVVDVDVLSVAFWT